jgi:hypothetical protein
VSVLLVTSLTARAGRSALAVALARRLAGDGRKARLLRLRDGSDDDAAATADAQMFASLPELRWQEGAASLDKAETAARQASRRKVTLVVEAPAGPGGEEALRRLGARAVLVSRGDPADGLERLAAAARSLGELLVGVVATAAPGRPEAAAGLLIEKGLPCLGVLPEDRTLASPRLAEVARALDAEYLVEPEDPDQIIEHFMIGSIAHDPGQAYFARREDKAVLTRFEKTDLQLAALNTPLACLILTGGQQPSPYLFDRARTEEAAVLLTARDTVGAMHAVGELFGTTPFGGPRKVQRMGELVEEFLELPALLSKLG